MILNIKNKRIWGVAKQKRRLSLQAKQAAWGYTFILPWIVGLLLFTAGPIVVVFCFSFCHYSILKPMVWCGLDNYRELFFEDPLFWKSLFNTFYYVGFTVPLRMLLGFTLALLLNTKIKKIMMTLFRTMCYVPYIVPIMASAVVWLWIFNPQWGLLNYALGSLHLPTPAWLVSERWSKPSLVLMNLWTVGGGMIIYLAGLQGIPKQLYEAADIDGASWRDKLLHVTIPMMTPTFFFTLIINIISAFQVFTYAYIMTDGGPLNSTLFYCLYNYRNAFEYFQMGYASAQAWILFLIVLFLTLLAFRSAKTWVHYGV